MRAITVQAYDGPEFDTPPDAAATRRLTYVVCSTQRSGSGLLCRGLGATGVAGAPTEYFNPLRRSVLSERWGCGPDLDAYAETLRGRRTSRAGVFGLKLHWYQVEELRDEAGFGDPAAFLTEILGGRLTYVHTRRRDIDRQAVSLWVADNTGIWASSDGPNDDLVPYSFDAIDERRRRIAHEEESWQRFFRANGIEPIEVVYEDLAASYPSVLAGVLERLVPRCAAEISPPATVRLADSRTQSLLDRFLEDRRR